MPWYEIAVSATDSTTLPLRHQKLEYRGDYLPTLALLLGSNLLDLAARTRAPKEHALLGLLHAAVEVQVWASLTSCEVFARAEQPFIQTMRGYVLTAPRSGRFSAGGSTPTAPPGSPPS